MLKDMVITSTNGTLVSSTAKVWGKLNLISRKTSDTIPSSAAFCIRVVPASARKASPKQPAAAASRSGRRFQPLRPAPLQLCDCAE